ncbi:nuclear transport factor 2 family protein [Streptomyces sirii]|uniref:nuclear transport factor 2 family protein n=1 Tax=Streptomyces sirii TaxID=3127701 RepID=UPI003D36566F
MTNPALHPHARLLAALYQDLTRIAQFADERIILHPATRDTIRRDPDVIGRDAVLAWETGLIRASGETLRVEVDTITANDHFGTVLGTLVARFGEQPFTGHFCGLWRFEDGKITEHWENLHDPELFASLMAQPRQWPRPSRGESMTPRNRERTGTALALAGITAALPSVWHTAAHATDDTYRCPQARHGQRHVHYHMAREVLITAGSLGAIAAGVLSGPDGERGLWRAMVLGAAGYSAAMWSGRPVTGIWAPNRKALLVHGASTAGLLAGLVLRRPARARR